MANLKRILLPALLFALCSLLALYRAEIASHLSARGTILSEQVLIYAFEVAWWLAAALLANLLLRVFVWDWVVATAFGRPVPRLLQDMAAVLVFLIALMFIVGVVFERSVSTLWATSGVVGIVLGFALRPLIADAFTGIAINMDDSYRIGSWIRFPLEGSNQYGCVTELNWRTTRIKTIDNNIVVAPNSVIGASIFTNLSEPGPQSRFRIPFRLDFEVPMDRAERIIRTGLSQACGDGYVLREPVSQVLVTGASYEGIEYTAIFWIAADKVPIELGLSAVRRHVIEQLQIAGVSFACPKQDFFTAPVPPPQESSREVLLRMLSPLALFQQLTPDELDELAARSRPQRWKPDEVLIESGEGGDSMFILAEGTLDVSMRDKKDDQEVKVAQLFPGQFFGEMSLLTGEPRSATVKAAMHAITYEITKADLQPLMELRPEMAESLSRVVAERQLHSAKALAGPKKGIQAGIQSLSKKILGKIRRFFS